MSVSIQFTERKGYRMKIPLQAPGEVVCEVTVAKQKEKYLAFVRPPVLSLNQVSHIQEWVASHAIDRGYSIVGKVFITAVDACLRLEWTTDEEEEE